MANHQGEKDRDYDAKLASEIFQSSTPKQTTPPQQQPLPVPLMPPVHGQGHGNTAAVVNALGHWADHETEEVETQEQLDDLQLQEKHESRVPENFKKTKQQNTQNFAHTMGRSGVEYKKQKAQQKAEKKKRTVKEDFHDRKQQLHLDAQEELPRSDLDGIVGVTSNRKEKNTQSTQPAQKVVPQLPQAITTPVANPTTTQGPVATVAAPILNPLPVHQPNDGNLEDIFGSDGGSIDDDPFSTSKVKLTEAEKKKLKLKDKKRL